MAPIKKRLLFFALCAALLLSVFYSALRDPLLVLSDEAEEEIVHGDGKTTLTLWYSDDALTDYLNREAVAFGQRDEELRVFPVLVSGLDFFEQLGEASALGEDFPDLYITTHDNLEKASLAGLADEAEYAEDFLRGDNFPPAALSSVTWHNKAVAYPFYGETTALLYNRTYLEDEVRSAAEEAGEPAPEGEELEKKVGELLPGTLKELIAFAGSYNAPERVEAVFSFDVNDLFTDYFFAGDAINVGGENGDDGSVVDIYSERSLECMNIYRQLGQFFAIDSDEIDGERVLSDFIEGKSVFTISTTDAARRLSEAMEEGESEFEFGAAPLFDLTEELKTRALCVTSCVVVNGFSEHTSQAHRFARFLTGDGAMDLYARVGKMPARYRADYGDDEKRAAMIGAFFRDYESSVPMPKMIETSNYWIRLEIAFTEIWNGADVNATMRRTAGALIRQITGEAAEPDYIEDPPEIELSDEISVDESE